MNIVVRNGAWLSLVERCVRDAEVAGSNPVAPTKKDSFARQCEAIFFVDIT